MESHHQSSNWSHFYQHSNTKTILNKSKSDLPGEKSSTNNNNCSSTTFSNAQQSPLSKNGYNYHNENVRKNKFNYNLNSSFVSASHFGGKYSQSKPSTKNRFPSNEFDDDDDDDANGLRPKLDDFSEEFFDRKKYNNNYDKNYHHLNNKPPIFGLKRNKPPFSVINKHVQNVDSSFSASTNSANLYDFKKPTTKQRQHYEEEQISSGGHSSKNFGEGRSPGKINNPSVSLLDWVENELDQRGIDSVIYGRHLLSLLQQYPSNNNVLDNNDNNGSNVHDELDSGYGSITANTNLKLFGRQLKPSAKNVSKIRYCESHQRLYPGQHGSHATNSWFAKQSNIFSTGNNYVRKYSSSSKDRNTQKAPTTTKWMHKRYLKQRSSPNKSPFHNASPTPRFNGVNKSDEDDYEDDDGYNDDCLFDHHCPDCQQKSSKFTKDYRKFTLIECLRSAVDNKDLNTKEMEAFIEELCLKFDQQQNAKKCSMKNTTALDWMMRSPNHEFKTRNHSLDSTRMFADEPKDEENDKDVHDVNDQNIIVGNKIEKMSNTAKITPRMTPEKILDQAKKYYDAFPALENKSVSSKSSLSSLAVSSNKTDSGDGSSSCSTSAKQFSSHQSSFDDSVFSDNVPTTVSVNMNENFDEKPMPAKFVPFSKNFDQNDNGWNGKKIIKNMVQNQSKLNVISVTSENNGGSTLVPSANNNDSINNNHNNNNNNQSNNNNNNNNNKPTVMKLKSTLLAGKSSRANLIVAPSSLNMGNQDGNMLLLSGGAGGAGGAEKNLTTLKKLNSSNNNNFNPNQQAQPISGVNNNNNNDNNQEITKNKESFRAESEAAAVGSTTTVSTLSAREMEKIYQIMPSFLNPIVKTTSSTVNDSVSNMITTSSTIDPKNNIATTTSSINKGFSDSAENNDDNHQMIEQQKQTKHQENSRYANNGAKNRFNFQYFNQQKNHFKNNNGKINYQQHPPKKISYSNNSKLILANYDKNSLNSTTDSGAKLIESNENYNHELNDDLNVKNNGYSKRTNKIDDNVVVDLLPNFLKCKPTPSSSENNKECHVMDYKIDVIDQQVRYTLKSKQQTALAIAANNNKSDKIYDSSQNEDNIKDDLKFNQNSAKTASDKMMKKQLAECQNSLTNSCLDESTNDENLSALMNRHQYHQQPNNEGSKSTQKNESRSSEIGSISDVLEEVGEKKHDPPSDEAIKQTSMADESFKWNHKRMNDLSNMWNCNCTLGYMNFFSKIDANNQDDLEQSTMTMNLHSDLVKELSAIVDFVQNKIIIDEDSESISMNDSSKQNLQSDIYKKEADQHLSSQTMNNWFNNVFGQSIDGDHQPDYGEYGPQKVDNHHEYSLLLDSSNETLINVNELINDILCSAKNDANEQQKFQCQDYAKIPSRQNDNIFHPITTENQNLADWPASSSLQCEETTKLPKKAEPQQSIPFSKRYKLKLKSETISSDKDVEQQPLTDQPLSEQANNFDDNFVNGHIVTADYDISSTLLYDNVKKHSSHLQPSLHSWLGQSSSSYENISHYETESDYFYDQIDGNIEGGGEPYCDENELNFESYGNDLYNFDGYLINIPKNEEPDLSSTSLNLGKNSSQNIYDLIDIKFKLENRSLIPDSDSKSVQKPCAFYLENACARVDCKFSHDISSIPCKYYNEGACYKEDFCPFLHDKPKSESDQIDADQNSLSKLDPNAKSFQFKIESDSDFPSLFDGGFDETQDPTAIGNDELRVDFVFKNKSNRNMTTTDNDEPSPLPKPPVRSINDAGRRVMTKLNLNEVEQYSTKNNLQNFAKCFVGTSADKLRHQSLNQQRIPQKSVQAEEEWPSLSVMADEPIQSNKLDKINNVSNNLHPKSSRINKSKNKSKESSINNRKLMTEAKGGQTTKSSNQEQSSSGSSQKNGNRIKNFSSFKSILNAS